jgi:hypothetical protein
MLGVAPALFALRRPVFSLFIPAHSLKAKAKAETGSLSFGGNKSMVK